MNNVLVAYMYLSITDSNASDSDYRIVTDKKP